MNGNYGKFRRLLEELFQLDHADLDFGIYRIMNQKRDEIMRFLDNDLLPQVQEAFREYQGVDRSGTQAELKEAIQQAESLGVDPESTRKVKDLREKLSQAVDVTKLENEVFSDLYDFFRRYYHEGDFLSLRRYKEGVYAIPYEGEEVKLHWANHDQYYVKLPSGKRVHFKLVEADTEKDNQKAEAGKERRFILCEEDSLAEVDGELHIRFEYRPDPGKRKQDTLNNAAFDTIMNMPGFSGWKAELAQPKPTQSNPNRTLLEKHLNDYTARNTFDYFIHKDLGGFLRRELDFYIKNEIMHLDDIENESAPHVEQYLSKIKVIRKIAHRIIQFLAQIEDFQKKLWLKKKFVVETNYCVTLDRVPEELYPEIIANDAQREEWVTLFDIDEIKGDLNIPSYSKPLTVEFLRANPFLLLETCLFPADFNDRLLSRFDDLDGNCEGLLVMSEARPALSLLHAASRDSIACAVIDPPYNTGNDGFAYKDTYQHSSWITFLDETGILLASVLKRSGILCSMIDDHELHNLGTVFDEIFGESNRVACAPWKSEASGGKEKTGLRTGHEYLLIYHNGNPNSISQAERSTGALDKVDQFGPYRKGREMRKWGGTSSRSDRPGQWFPLIAPDGTQVFPIKNDGTEGHWRWGKPNENIKAALTNPDIFHWEKCPFDSGKSYNGETTRWVPFEKIRDIKKSVGWSTWLDSYGTNADATRELKELFGFKPFDTPKPTHLVKWVVSLHADDDGRVLDCFAGSGTTGHAVISLNREDKSCRKYILCELDNSSMAVIISRLKKVVYSKDWKNGKPISREGISHMLKYIRLESYEDTLNNLGLKRSEEQDSLLAESDSFRETYMLSYMLDVESNGSPSLLNVDAFEDPFNYKLKIGTGSAGETRPVTVDLVETFSYLLGLTVHHIDHIRGFRVVQGTNPEGEKALVIWRNLREKSSEDLEEFFRKQEYNPKDMEFDLIYVNGDNNLENIRRQDETWKVRLIEDDFKRLMFEVEDAGRF